MHSLLHYIPRFFILFLEGLFLIFNQILSIRAVGRHVESADKIKKIILEMIFVSIFRKIKVGGFVNQ